MSSRSRSRGAHGGRRGRPSAGRKGLRGERLGTETISVEELGRQIGAEAVAQAGDLAGPLEALHYASHMTYLWEGGRPVIGREAADAIGTEVVERIAEATAPQALVVLRAIATVADEPVGATAAARVPAMALQVDGAPPWLATLGSPEAMRAGRVEDPTTDDGAIVLFDLAWPCGDAGGISVFIDPRRGGIAKHILVGPSIADCVEEITEHEGRRWPFEELEPCDAADLVRAGVEATEAGELTHVGETYPSQRAFLRAVLRRIEAEAVPRNRAA